MSLTAECDDYFKQVEQGLYAERFDQEVNLLPFVQAQAFSEQFSGHPTLDALDGLILDDPDTSSHHVWVCESPLAGQVFYLSHDDDSRIVFPSLSAFLTAAQQALERSCCLSELHPSHTPLCPDQTGLSNFITHLCGNDEHEEIAIPLIPSLDLQDFPLLRRLASADNFFLSEVLAQEIKKRPRADLLTIAELCSAHPHPQAAKAGVAALRAIKAL
ncbi:hypothetical protein MTR80_05730 [Alcaligenes aquatilis]|uniref:SMI1/KNR4 family protein n=1 Tax=Alcaligenes aquatilis TaxID=323284 RepID=A0ABY4NMR8_9BURK|nr:hypothetical protein [Alcaligenes aquatilis]UQN37201.1 hypothetical protein MTR80_05730 [Alcaligenes aquatilis]